MIKGLNINVIAPANVSLEAGLPVVAVCSPFVVSADIPDTTIIV